MHLVMIGGTDAGISAALRARELDPAAEVTVVVADAYPNFSICGISYYVSGEVPHWRNRRRSFDALGPPRRPADSRPCAGQPRPTWPGQSLAMLWYPAPGRYPGDVAGHRARAALCQTKAEPSTADMIDNLPGRPGSR